MGAMFFRKRDEMEIRLMSERDEVSSEACLKNIIATLLRIISLYAKESDELDTRRFKQELSDILIKIRGTSDIYELTKLNEDLKRLILKQLEAERIYDERRFSELKDLVRMLMKSLNELVEEDRGFGEALREDIMKLEAASRLEDIKQLKQELARIVSEMQEQLKERQENLERAADELAMKVLDLEERLSQMTEEALVDETTKLFNRRALMRRLSDEIARYAVTNIPFSLVIFDIDNFKRINDEHGHLIGDRVLYMIGRIARETFRTDDFVARMAGDEFAAILMGCTGTESWNAVERLRDNIARKVFKYNRDGETVSLTVTISAGVAWVRKNDTPESLLERADQAMYLAKRRGRNQVVVETELEGERG